MDRKPSSTSGGENSKTQLEEVKKFLGPLAAEYSEAQLAQLRRELYAMAELLLDIYRYKRRQKAAAEKSGKDFDTPSSSS